MARRAPAGAREVAARMETLKAKIGAKDAAKVYNVHTSTIYKVTKLFREGRPLSEYVTSPKTVSRWQAREKQMVTSIKDYTAREVVGKSLQYTPTELARAYTEFTGEKISRQKISRLQRQMKTATGEEAREIGSTIRRAVAGIETSMREVDGLRIFNASSAQIPGTPEKRALFKTEKEAVDWANKRGRADDFFAVKSKRGYQMYFDWYKYYDKPRRK